MRSLGGGGGAGGAQAGKVAAAAAAATPAKNVKIDQADVALLVDELDLSKVRATELLRSHEGDAVLAMRAFVTS